MTETIGFEEHKFHIHDLSKIFNHLTKGTYKNPLESCIVEIVANAKDSMVEANKANSPIFFDLSKDNELSIKDEGLGLNSEFMLEKYLAVGFSSKDDTSQIGRLGIGRVSVLAYTNSYKVISVYDNIKSTYLICLEPKKLPTCIQISNEDTTECNGVTVSFKIKEEDISEIIPIIKKRLINFHNIIYTGINYTPPTLYEYNTFRIHEYLEKGKLLINNMLYDSDITIPNVFIKIKEDLESTIDRTNIQWEEKDAKNVVKNTIQEVEKEILNLYNKQSVIYDNYIEWNFKFKEYFYLHNNKFQVDVNKEDYYSGYKFSSDIFPYINNLFLLLYNVSKYKKVVKEKKLRMLLIFIYQM